MFPGEAPRSHSLSHLARGANFIDRDRLFRLFDEIVVNKRDDAASIALVYGAVATGAKHERVRNPNKCNDPAIATRHFEKAVGMFQRLGGKYTITKFKVNSLALQEYSISANISQAALTLVRCHRTFSPMSHGLKFRSLHLLCDGYQMRFRGSWQIVHSTHRLCD